MFYFSMHLNNMRANAVVNNTVRPQQQNNGPQTLGVTSPINTSFPSPKDLQRDKELEKCLREYGLFESEEELAHR